MSSWRCMRKYGMWHAHSINLMPGSLVALCWNDIRLIWLLLCLHLCFKCVLNLCWRILGAFLVFKLFISWDCRGRTILYQVLRIWFGLVVLLDFLVWLGVISLIVCILKSTFLCISLTLHILLHNVFCPKLSLFFNVFRIKIFLLVFVICRRSRRVL